MTEQAPPDYYFQNIIFNPKYYDNEVNNNITKYEADNKYIKYNSSNLQLTKTEAGLTTTINDLRLTSIGRLNNLFNLPTNTSTATPYSRLVLIDNTTRSTTWFPSSGNVGYNSTTSILTTENASGAIPDITNLVMSGSIGSSTAEKFILPSNSSSASVGSVLTLSNTSTKATTWVSLPTAITDYTNYNNTAQTLISNVSGTPTTVNALVLPSIGASILQKFGLPTNTSSASSGAILTLGASNLTSWTNPTVAITNYVNFDSGTSNLISNVSGTATTITTINTSGLITAGSIKSNTAMNSATINTTGLLTAGSINAGSGLIQTTGEVKGRLLTIQNATPATTATITTAGAITCTSLSAGTGIISTSGAINGGAITGTSLSAGTGIISTTGAVNCATINTTGSINAGSGLIQTTGNLQSRGLAIKNTSNVDVATISNTGVMTGTTLTLNGVSGLSCYNLDIRNSSDNSFRGSINGLFGLFSFRGAIECTEYTIKNFTTSTINATINSLGEINCKALTCTTINTNNNNITTGSGTITSQGLAIQNINNANVATISNLGALVCTSLNSGSGLVQTTGNLQSRGLTIKNTSNADVATISNLGAIIATSLNSGSGLVQTTGNLQSRGLTIKNTSNADVATISNLGALSCTTITSNNNTITSGTSSISGGSILSSTFNSGAPGSGLDIGTNQVAGNLTIGNSASRTGSVNICTLASNNAINIGNTSSTQQLTINRPIRQSGNLVYSSGQEIGYAFGTSGFFSVTNIPSNAPVPNVRSDTPIPFGDLVDGGIYLVTYSIQILPQATLDLTRFQYGMFSSSSNNYLNGLSQNQSMVNGTVATRLNTSDTYSYSGSGHFKYSSGITYTFSFIMAFLATSPIVATNIELIRIR